MSYQKLWATCSHKTSRMMTACTSGACLGKFFKEVTVEPVLFLYMFSTFSQYALFQDLVYSKVCWGQFSGNMDICLNLHKKEYKAELETVQTLSSHWILMSTISLVCPSILIAMYLGSWSDRFGRKWPVVFPPLGGVCACMVYVAISLREDASVAWICLASLLSGLSGGFVSCIMSCMTYVASVSTEDNRTTRISRLEAMIFVGGTIGPFISGSVLEITGHAYAFFYMMMCYAFAFFYAIFFVRDVDANGEVIVRGRHVVDHPDQEDADSRSGRCGSSNSGRSRNKSSDTIPSSVATTTTSGGEDIEQREGLLSASSDLHVVVETISESEENISSPTSSSSIHLPTSDDLDGHDENVGDSPRLVDFSLPDLSGNGGEKRILELENEGISIIHEIPQKNGDAGVVLTVNQDHNHPNLHKHHQHHHLQNNRNSLGGSGRSSSLHGHDDVSSANSDDDHRNFIRRRRHSSNLDDGTGEPTELTSSSSCCAKYFGTSHFLSALMTVTRKRENGRRTLLISSVFASFVFMIVTAGEMDVAYLFARAEPLKWSYQTYSYFFGFKYGFGALALLTAMPLFQRLQIEDSTLAILGIVSRMAALILYGLSVNTYMAFSVPLVAVFSVFTIPATRSLLSKMVNPDEQGKMFAFVAMMEDLCTMVASLIFNSIYPLTRPIMQGMIFLIAASFLIIPVIIMWFVRWKTLKIQRLAQVSRISRAHLNSVEGADPATLLCLPKDFQVGK